MTEAVFDKVGDQFVGYYDTVRGYVREQLTRRFLSSYIEDEALTVLDVGGGDGRDAVWLARQGHTVRLIDPSTAMLEKAASRVSGEGLDGRVVLEGGDPEELLQGVDGSFDIVLSHGVLMYLDEPQAHLNLLGRVIKPGGIVSVLTKGKAGSLLRLLHKGDVKAAAELQTTDHLVNNLKIKVLAATEDLIAPMLRLAHLSLSQSFGVRVATEFDYRPINELPSEELASIVDVEAALGSDPRTKGMGQMLHFICKREGD